MYCRFIDSVARGLKQRYNGSLSWYNIKLYMDKQQLKAGDSERFVINEGSVIMRLLSQAGIQLGNIQLRF